jgi:hypothetical protein
MAIPQFLHPLTADSKRPKFTWILFLAALGALYLYFAQTGKNGNSTLLRQQPPAKTQPGAYNPNNQELLREVYSQAADPTEIAQKKAALQAVKNQEGNANPEANRVTEQEIAQNFDQARDAKLAQQQKVSDFDERLRKFMEKPHTAQQLQQFKQDNQPPPDPDNNWKTIAELVAQKQLSPKATVVMSGVTPVNTASPTPAPTTPLAAAKEEYRKAIDWDDSDELPNFLPLHVAPIPCVLVDNIKTGALKQRVRALICQDVIYAYRVQLRAYSAMLLGEVASEPIGDTLDIHFDTMVFADGSELPISGTAYSPEDPRYPGEGNHRGVHGTLVTPPLYTKILSWLGNAAESGLQQYLADSQNLQPSYGYGAANNSQFPSGAQTGTTTTTTVTDPKTGKQTVTTTQDFSAPNNLNPNYRSRIAVAAGSSAASQLNQELQSTLQKYKPYVTVDRGYPVWVDLDQTINISARRRNGVLHAQLTEAEAEGRSTALPQQPYYPPGDARDNSAQQVTNPQLSSGLVNNPNIVNPTAVPNGVNTASNNNNAAIEQQLLAMRLAQQRRYQQAAGEPTPSPVPFPPNPNLQNFQPVQ